MILFHWNCLQIKGTWMGAFFYEPGCIAALGLSKDHRPLQVYPEMRGFVVETYQPFISIGITSQFLKASRNNQ